MNKVNPRKQAGHLVFEYELGAPPDMVWQAIGVPEPILQDIHQLRAT
uniref:Uncharacterized protein n=1 Tax=Sinorhizobium medicae TaxID=110321 RepID=D1CT59_9HYPH|nr:conserved hypothetical protein [Sinorhizobium medicae]